MNFLLFTPILNIFLLEVYADISSEIRNFNYCDYNKFCTSSQHIGCIRSQDFWGPDCAKFENTEVKKLDRSFMEYVLALHNEYRNTVALGQLKGFSKSARMATVQWDDTLAYLAELNVRQCTIDHDKCRATSSYLYSGQNLCISAYYEDIIAEDFLWECMEFWFSEYQLANQTVINKWPKGLDTTVGHFAQMVNDRTTRVGCSIITYYDAMFEVHFKLLGCNYASTSVIGYPVYKMYRTSYECRLGTNPNYPGLCNINENISPNELSR